MTRATLLWILPFLLLSERPALAGENAPTRLPAEPLFSRHIVPLFSKLGCNAGTCHGAVNGKNGFKLSLFGYDPAADHQRLLRELGGRRLNLATPDQSLLLLKAVGRLPHEGGKRLKVGSPEYQMLLHWITQGAPLDPLEKSKIVHVSVTPELQTTKPGESYPVRVEAAFADGTKEDVTALATFESRDRAVVDVDREGQVKTAGVGSGTLIVRFRGEPAVSRVFVPVDATTAFPAVKEHNFIDRHVLEKLHRLNIHPAAQSDDATFLRRASIDVAGELPAPEEIRKFVADTRNDKRERKIDELLARPGHAALWATRFCDLLKPQFREDSRIWVDQAYVRRFYEWIRTRLLDNVPYDELVARIIAATSAEGRTKEEVLQELQALAEEDAAQTTELKAYNGRRTLDMYWLRANASGVQGTIQFAHAFLGLRLQCAQCHRHPTDVWQQDDLLSFANFFSRVTRGGEKQPPAEAKQQADEAKQTAEEVKKMRDKAKTLPQDEADKLLAEATALERRSNTKGRYNYLRATFTGVAHDPKGKFVELATPLGKAGSKQFRLLGSTKATDLPAGKDPRDVVLSWLRQPDNPFFAKAIVNRVWAHYFGRGIVDPPDDLSPLNPPTHPELLDELCKGFIQNKFDLHWLHRTILTSRTYQQSAEPNATNRADKVNYARHQVRRLSAEVLVDAINHATGAQESYPDNSYIPAGARALEVPGMTNFGKSAASMDYAFEAFGRSRRNVESQCDCDASASPSLVQGLYLAAYGDVQKKIADPQGRAATIAKEQPDDGKRIEEAFLWTLSRVPTAAERQLFQEHLKKNASPQQGMEDLLWILLNTREFQLNR